MAMSIVPLLTRKTDEIAVDFTVFDDEMHMPVRVSGKLTRKETGENRQILFDGAIFYTWVEQCGRCLKDCTVPVQFNCKEEFSETVSEDSEAFSYDGKEIDFTDMLRTNIAFTKPAKVLCHEACKGLCPVCGTNWNEGSCQCSNNKRNNAFDELIAATLL